MTESTWTCAVCGKLNSPTRNSCKSCNAVRGAEKPVTTAITTTSPTPAQPTPMQQNVIIQQASGGEPGCLVQGIWFIFVGWWAGAFAVGLAWLFNVLIITLPIGMAILNNVPKVLALQNPKKTLRVVQDGNTTRISEVEADQHPFLIRALFFIFVGWWWSGIWMGIAYFLCGLIITMPIGLGMFRSTPAMTTLQRY